jgi:Response regulators consisting of a CheY-like receiver domain and a winged-helix DNA-binding domain
MNKTHYTSGEVAKLCGVSLRTVLNWIAKGLLKAHQLPGARGDNRVLVEDLVVFMRASNLPLPTALEPQRRFALIVDDELAMAKSIQRVLRVNGFQTAIATDGFTAGMLYAKEKPLLMTLDLQMPKLNGIDVLKDIGGEKYGKILVISGMAEDTLSLALAHGADATLHKPFDNEQLESIVSEWFC